MKAKIGSHVVIYEFLRRGASEPDEFVDIDGITWTRCHYAVKLNPETKKMELQLTSDGKPKVVRNRGRKIGVIMALDNGKIGWSVMDDRDYISTDRPGANFNIDHAIAAAYRKAFASDDDKARHPIPSRFRYEYNCMIDRMNRYFFNPDAKPISNRHVDVLSGEVIEEK